MTYRIISQQRVVPLTLAAASKVYMIDDPAGTPVFVDDTTDFNDAGAADVLFWPAAEAVGDRLAIGYTRPFRRIRLTLSTAGVGGTIAVTYWNGTAWTAVSGLVDGSTGLTAGTSTYEMTFDMPTDWVALELNDDGVDRYYLGIDVATVYAPNPVLSRGWILRGTPLTIPARREKASGGELAVTCLNTTTTDAYLCMAGHDDLSSELLPANAASKYDSLPLAWVEVAESPLEIYSPETDPGAVDVTIYGQGA